MSVEFIGPEDAKIFLVGEAPGREEEVQGEPFVGGAGRILNWLMGEAGIFRRDCRIGNVMRARPPNNNFDVFYKDGKKRKEPCDELIAGRQYLKEQILKCKPNVVVALGNEALRALMGLSGAFSWRGSILWSDELGCKVIPTIHPAALMRIWKKMPLVVFDLSRIKEESETAEYNVPERNLAVKPTYEKVMFTLHNMLERADKIAFDIETTRGRPPEMTCIAFSTTANGAISIPFIYGGKFDYFTIEEEMQVMKLVKAVLESNIKKIAQNAQFDMGVLYNRYGIKVKNLWMDTMCAQHTIYPELEKGLGVLCSIYTKQPYYKHEGKSGDDEEFWRYNAMDACITFEVAEAMEKELNEFGVRKFYDEQVNKLIAPLMEMQLRGAKADTERLPVVMKTLSDSAEAEQKKLDALCGYEINCNSAPQVMELLYEKLKLPKKYKQKSGNLTADKQALDELYAKFPENKVLMQIKTARQAYDEYGTFSPTTKSGEIKPIPPFLHGRIHTSYNIGGRVEVGGDSEKIISGPESGRLSSSKSIVVGCGTNLQNITEGDLRRVIIPDEGMVFISTDLWQAEAFPVAWLAEEHSMKKTLLSGVKIHKLVASKVFGIPMEDITSDMQEYKLGKRLVHACNYGMGPKLFSYYAGVSFSDGKKLRERYFIMFPKIRTNFHMWVEKELKRTRMLVTPFGRKRVFYDRWSSNMLMDAYSYIPQSTIGDYLNTALMNFYYSETRSPQWQLVLQIHDSYIVQCPEKDVPNCALEIEKSFDFNITIKGEKVHIPIEMKVGKNWNDMKEEKEVK